MFQPVEDQYRQDRGGGDYLFNLHAVVSLRLRRAFRGISPSG
jgi:hypothetical protein